MLDDTTQLIFPDCGMVELPLVFEPQCLRCIATGPGGHPLHVLLDTGTDPSAIDLTLARQWGLRVGEFALGHGAASNDVPFTETVVPWLRLGELLLRDLFALALDLRSAPFAVDIVLGYNVLRQVVLHVDYVTHRLRLSHPDMGLPALSPSAAMLPLTFFEHFPALTNIMVGDGVHIPIATIDTGSNGGLTLGPDLAHSLGLQSGTQMVTSGQGAGFFSGYLDILRGHADMVQLGPFALHNVELDTAGSGAGDLRRSGRANIGNRLLSRFANVTLDYERKQCVLETMLASTTPES